MYSFSVPTQVTQHPGTSVYRSSVPAVLALSPHHHGTSVYHSLVPAMLTLPYHPGTSVHRSSVPVGQHSSGLTNTGCCSSLTHVTVQYSTCSSFSLSTSLPTQTFISQVCPNRRQTIINILYRSLMQKSQFLVPWYRLCLER